MCEKANGDKDMIGISISGVDLEHLDPTTSCHILIWWVLLNHLPILIHKIHSTCIFKLYNCLTSQSLSSYSNRVLNREETRWNILAGDRHVTLVSGSLFHKRPKFIKKQLKTTNVSNMRTAYFLSWVEIKHNSSIGQY